MAKILNTKDKKQMLVRQLKKPRTINEAIQRIKDSDDKRKVPRDWKFYTHLNKLTGVMQREGLIVQIGETANAHKRTEKVWQAVQ